jgi:hypothetical protein
VSIGDYSNEMERLIFLSLLVGSFQVRERQEQRQEGFIGVRAVLSHGDLLEAFEFVVATPMRSRREQTEFIGSRRMASSCVVGTTPRITQGFRTFPYHMHIGLCDRVESSDAMNIAQAMASIEVVILQVNEIREGSSKRKLHGST